MKLHWILLSTCFVEPSFCISFSLSSAPILTDDVPWSYAAHNICGSTLSVTLQAMSSVKQRAQELCMKD